jgi:hypothetical protein
MSCFDAPKRHHRPDRFLSPLLSKLHAVSFADWGRFLCSFSLFSGFLFAAKCFKRRAESASALTI